MTHNQILIRDSLLATIRRATEILQLSDNWADIDDETLNNIEHINTVLMQASNKIYDELPF